MRKNIWKLSITAIIAAILIIATWFAPIPIAANLRIAIITLMAILAIAIELWLIWHSATQLPKSDRQSQELDNISEKLIQAIKYWQQQLSYINRLSLRKKPWLFLIGSPSSGKTSLLANSQLQLHSSHSSSVKPIKPTRSAQFWSNPNALLIDISGEWYTAKHKSDQEKCWHHLLTIAEQYRKKNAPTHIINVIDFTKIADSDSNKRQTEFDLIAHQLQFLRDWNPQCEITLVINKSDCMPGFQDFFSYLNNEEQLCGVGFSHQSDKPLMDSIKQQLQAFATHISSQTIKRLHHERNLERRDALKDLPCQIQRLTEVIFHILENLPGRVTRNIRGVYLTSCEQSHTLSDLFELDTTAPLPIQLPTGDHKKNQIYFVKKLFQNLISLRDEPHTSKRWLGEYNHIGAGVIVILLAVFTLHKGFQSNEFALNQTSDQLNQTSDESVPTWISTINTFQLAKTQLHSHQAINYRWIGLNAASNVDNAITNNLNQLLITNLYPWVKNIIVKKLTDDIQTKSPKLFYDLATYIRITKSSSSPEEIIPWFSQYWTNEYPNNAELVNQLTTSLKQLMQSDNWHPFAANNSLIKEAQQILQQSPQSQIVFMMLATQFSRTNVPVNPNLTLPDNTPLLTINPMYQLSEFNKIYSTEIPRLAKKLTDNNWVLGKPIYETISSTEKDALIKSAQQRYLVAFSKNWQNSFDQMVLHNASNLRSILILSNLLGKTDSGIWSTLNQVTDFMLKQSQLPIDQEKYWNTINDYLSKSENKKIIHAAFDNFSQYIRQILYASDPEAAAFNRTQSRMQKQSETNPIQIMLTLTQITPEPIGLWLKNSGQSTWSQLMAMSAHYINRAWQDQLLSAYNDNIKNAFPITAQAKNNISVAQFNDFFGPGGSIQQFYNQYLNGFLNTDQAYWTTKQLDNQSLPISRASLDALIRASLIQKMFYKNNHDQPTLAFTLLPINLSKNVKSFVLNIGGQMLTVGRNNQTVFQGKWPGPDSNFVTMRFNTLDASPPTVTATGPWAWLRILSTATIKPTRDPRVFILTFNLAGNSAQFQMTAGNKVNPYTPGILNAFTLPDSMLATTPPS